MFAELTSQAENLNVHCTIRDRVIGPADGIDDLLAREHPTGTAGEKVEDLEFAGSQSDRPTGRDDLVTAGMNAQVTRDDAFLLVGSVRARVADGRLHPRHEFAGTERLADIVVGSQLESGDDVGFLATRSYHDDGNRSGRGLTLKPATHFEAVEAGQHQVEQHDVRPDAADQL